MRKVLVVEDDRFISTILAMFLKDLGHELVGKCETGIEAVEMCRKEKPDVVLMDIHIEGALDGIQTTEKLKNEFDVPVIYVSSDTSSYIIERAIVTNSYGFLVKPVNKKELGISIDLAYYKHKVDVEQKERERGYRQFISESPVPIVIVNDGKIQYLNNLALEVVFKTHYIEDVLLQPFMNFVAEDDRDVVSRLFDDFRAAGRCFKCQTIRFRDVHGRYNLVEIDGSGVKFNNKSSLQVIIRDVSEDMDTRNRMESYRAALIKSNVPFVVSTPDLVVVESCFNGEYLEHGPGMNSRKVKIDVEAEKKDLLKKPKGSVRVRINVDGEDKGEFEVLKTLDFNGNVSQLVFVQE
jgi:PAS domain S-box-containing protein